MGKTLLGEGCGEKTGRNTANTKKLIIFAWLMLRQDGRIGVIWKWGVEGRNG